VDTLGGIVTDLTTLAAEFEASATPEGQFKQVMAEYDALVLRLARHPAGRQITLVGQNWVHPDIEQRIDLNEEEKMSAIRLLLLRDQVRAQAQKADGRVRQIDIFRERLTEFTAKKSEPSVLAGIEEEIRKEQTPLKVCTETIRGLLTDMTRLADELDPPKKTAPRPNEDQRFHRVRQLREQIDQFEMAKAGIERIKTFIQGAETKLLDLESQRKRSTDAKATADLDMKISLSKKEITFAKDELAEETSRFSKMTPPTDLQKQLDQLRKEIADSLEKKGPAKGKD
jgi:hypothetical protein